MFVLLNLILPCLGRLLAPTVGTDRPLAPRPGVPQAARLPAGAAQPILLALIHAPTPRLAP